MSVHFEEVDRIAWLAFLDTPAGKTGLAYLREAKRPMVRINGEPHEMHLDLGRQLGFDDAILEVEKLSRLPEDRKRLTADRPSLQATRNYDTTQRTTD